MRRDRESQYSPECFEHAELIWSPIRELPYGPATDERSRERPDRCQHPTTRVIPPETLLAFTGASTDGEWFKSRRTTTTCPAEGNTLPIGGNAGQKPAEPKETPPNDGVLPLAFFHWRKTMTSQTTATAAPTLMQFNSLTLAAAATAAIAATA